VFTHSPAFFFAKNRICATIKTMSNTNIFATNSSKQTQKLGEILAKELKGGEIICLTGELGSGKTTFAQGILRGFKVKGPHTSPTFVVMKKYKAKFSIFNFQFSNKSKISKSKKEYQIINVYHIDAYRVGSKDILDLGWEEIIANKNNIIIVEWAERIRGIVPKNAVWIKFEHKGEEERKIFIKSQCQNPNDK
jgi:tRNA threonylcarbamoyladenosine biosynthesis protein TsaE